MLATLCKTLKMNSDVELLWGLELLDQKCDYTFDPIIFDNYSSVSFSAFTFLSSLPTMIVYFQVPFSSFL